MELFIRIKDGKPFEHPIFGDNFRQAFPHVDVNNLPAEFARFKRVPMPTFNVYDVYEGVTYELVNGVYKDVHHARPMTDAEKTDKQNQVKQEWQQFGYASWVFYEETCSFKPPVSYPNDGKIYSWNEATTSWVEINNA
jgi:hypothetical protein